VSDRPSFFEAWDSTLSPLLDREALLGLLAGLDRAGALGSLAQTRPHGTLGDVLGLPEPVTIELTKGLVANAVLEESSDGVRLTAPWRALVADTAFVSIGDLLHSSRIHARLLQGIGEGDYWTMPSADRIVLARAISPNPYADGLVAAFRADIESDPGRADMLRPGARLLELGCGVAGRILTTLRAVPTLTAVGVELSPDLAEEAERRAHELGLSERFTVVCTDAREFTTAEPFDRGFWSQFFFPADAREAALSAAHGALRTGAVITSPVADDGPSDALFRVLLASWDVPLRTADELAQEYVAAGFVDVEVDASRPGPTTVRAVRP
jgi:Methyltransferase domain